MGGSGKIFLLRPYNVEFFEVVFEFRYISKLNSMHSRPFCSGNIGSEVIYEHSLFRLYTSSLEGETKDGIFRLGKVNLIRKNEGLKVLKDTLLFVNDGVVVHGIGDHAYDVIFPECAGKSEHRPIYPGISLMKLLPNMLVIFLGQFLLDTKMPEKPSRELQRTLTAQMQRPIFRLHHSRNSFWLDMKLFSQDAGHAPFPGCHHITQIKEDRLYWFICSFTRHTFIN